MAHFNSAEGIQSMCATQINNLAGSLKARLSAQWGWSFIMGPSATKSF